MVTPVRGNARPSGIRAWDLKTVTVRQFDTSQATRIQKFDVTVPSDATTSGTTFARFRYWFMFFFVFFLLFFFLAKPGLFHLEALPCDWLRFEDYSLVIAAARYLSTVGDAPGLCLGYRDIVVVRTCVSGCRVKPYYRT